MNRFFEAVKNMFRIADLRNRVLFTLALLAVYRIGAHIPIPGHQLARCSTSFSTRRAGLVPRNFRSVQRRKLPPHDDFRARHHAVHHLVHHPAVDDRGVPVSRTLQKEGELGRRKITQYTRYLTIVLSIIQGTSIATALQTQAIGGQSLVYHPGFGFILMTMLTLTTGSAFIMWLGEQITERGIGNGMSLIIFVGIVVGLAARHPRPLRNGQVRPVGRVHAAGSDPAARLMIAVVAFIVFVEGGQRRIPVQYAKRVVGRRVMGGQSTYLPLRVNSGGVIPPIFASSLLAFPATIALIFGAKYVFLRTIADRLKWGEPLYTLIYITLILVFAFFYVGIVFNPTELADNMRKNGGFIPGIRPGRTTSDHVSHILKRLTFIGAIYLAMVCLLPEWMITGIHLDHIGWGIGGWFDRHFPVWFLKGLGVQFYFGGTSLLIVVGVAMDTVQQLEAQLVMRNYEGFARKGRLRGRR